MLQSTSPYASERVHLDPDFNLGVDGHFEKVQLICDLRVYLNLLVKFVEGLGPGLRQFVCFEGNRVS